MGSSVELLLLLPDSFPPRILSHVSAAKPDNPTSRSSTKMNLPTRKNDCIDSVEDAWVDRRGNLTIT